SNAGGIKTSTVAVIVLIFINEIKGEKHVNYHNRTIPAGKIRQALVIFWTMIIWFYAGLALVVWLETESFGGIFLETLSAVSTVGITGDLMVDFSAAGKAIIGILMFVGRVGPLFILSSLIGERDETMIKKYASVDILIG